VKLGLSATSNEFGIEFWNLKPLDGLFFAGDKTK
jgi:hypothetical protein